MDADATHAQLREFIGNFGKLRALHQSIDKPMKMSETADEWLERNGREMRERQVLRKGRYFPHSRQCYLNAFNLFNRGQGLHYCEGYTVIDTCPLPVWHGWCVNEAGAILDPSVHQDRQAIYFGVVWKDSFTRRCWRTLIAQDLIGIIPNVYIFRDKKPGWLDAGVAS